MGRSARKAALRAAALAATTTTQLPLASFATSAELSSGAQFNGDRVVLPLYCAIRSQKKHLITTGFFFLLQGFSSLVCSRVCPTAFCTEYYIDGQRFRAVVDTGSPFLMVDGYFDSRGTSSGVFLNDEQSVPLNDMSGEMYGGQDVDVEWRRGSLRLAGCTRAASSRRAYSSTASAAHAPAHVDDSQKWRRSVRADQLWRGAYVSGQRRRRRHLFGLGKETASRIAYDRHFSEQTDVRAAAPAAAHTHAPSPLPSHLFFFMLTCHCGRASSRVAQIQSMEFDFVRRTLTLARRPLLGRGTDAIPLIDLRPLGAPVATYALKVKRLVANGQEMPLKGPVVAVVDTGTTGLVISDSLYDSDEFPLPGTRCAARVSSYTPTSLISFPRIAILLLTYTLSSFVSCLQARPCASLTSRSRQRAQDHHIEREPQTAER